MHGYSPVALLFFTGSLCTWFNAVFASGFGILELCGGEETKVLAAVSP